MGQILSTSTCKRTIDVTNILNCLAILMKMLINVEMFILRSEDNFWVGAVLGNFNDTKQLSGLKMINHIQDQEHVLISTTAAAAWIRFCKNSNSQIMS